MMRFLRCVLYTGAMLLAANLWATTALAGVLDETFADHGKKVLDFSGSPGASGLEYAIANCPAANGRQLVVMRDSNSGILVTRLNFDGSLDTGFGSNGLRRHPVPLSNLIGPVSAAVCRADGGIWIAAVAHFSDEDERIRLVALDAQGELVPGGAFGSQGFADIALQSDGSSLQAGRDVRGFNQAPDGRAFVTGDVMGATGSTLPWLVALDADGGLRGAPVLQPTGLTGSINATTAGVGPGGGIWVVGRGNGANNWRTVYRGYVDPKSLALVNTELFQIPGQHVDVSGGEMVRSGVMVVGAARRANFSSPGQPMLLVLRTGGVINALDMPAAQPLADDGMQTGISAEGKAIVALPDQRVLYATGAERWDGAQFGGYKGWYFAQAVIGASAAEDRVDVDFGDGGSAVYRAASGEPDCSGVLNTQYHVRASLWQGRPTAIGFWNRHCNPEGERDAVLLRLRPRDLIFANGFE